jgi:hypothetical protein
MDEFDSQNVELVANFGSLYKGVKKHWSITYHYRRMVCVSTHCDVQHNQLKKTHFGRRNIIGTGCHISCNYTAHERHCI